MFHQNRFLSVAEFVQKTQGTPHTLGRNTLLMVDNAPLVSTAQMAALIRIAKNARVILLGDTAGLATWQSSNPFNLMVESGMNTALLKQVVQPSLLQPAIAETLAGQLKQAFSNLHPRLMAISDDKARLQAIGNQYAALSPSEQEDTLVLMPTRTACTEANTAIRDVLKNTEQLPASETVIQALLPKPFKRAAYGLAENYQKGEWLRIRGQYFKIVDRQLPRNTLILQNLQGNTHRCALNKMRNLLSSFEVFKEATRVLSPGDKVLYQRNHARLQLSAGEALTVVRCDKRHLTLRRTNQKKVRLDTRDPSHRHIEYGYALTPYGAMNQKASTVIAYQKATSPLSHQRTFYSLLNRASKAVWLYTENKEVLLRNVMRYTGTALPLLDQLLGENKPLHTPHYFTQLEKAIAQVLSRQQETAIANKRAAHSPEGRAKEAVHYALAHLSEREAGFTYNAVLEVAIKSALGEVGSEQMEAAIATAQRQGDLLEGEGAWTTRETAQMEREIIALAKADVGQAMVDPARVKAYLTAHPLKPEHAAAVTAWTQSSNRIVMVEGYAGTQKTTLLQKVEPLLNQAGLQLESLAPTHAAVKELRARGLNARTLDSFLGSPQTTEQSVRVIDEGSMVSNRRMHHFLTLEQEHDKPALVMGDRAQYMPIEAGNPQALLQAAGVTTTKLTDIVRQENPVLRQAVYEIYDNKLAAAFETLSDCFIEIGRETETSDLSSKKLKIPKSKSKGLPRDDPYQRFERIAKDYTALSPTERAKTLVITGGNAARQAINEAIREQLKTQGELTGSGVKTSVFVQQDRTPIQLTRANQYERGQWLRFGRSEPCIAAGSYLQVVEIHPHENWLTLQKPTGETVLWYPAQSARTSRVQLYSAEKRELLPGDQLRWTRTDKKLGLISPELIRVERIEKKMAWVTPLHITEAGLTSAGPERTLPFNDLHYRHWDYAYALTGYAAQGKSIFRVLCNIDSYSRYLTNARFFLIAVTRSIQQLTLYTDHKANLLEKLIKTPAHKLSALEILGEIPFETLARKKEREKTPPLKTETHTDSKKPEAPQKNHRPAQPSLDAKRIIQSLHQHAESMVKKILGEPKFRNATHYQYSHSEQLGGENTKATGGSLSVAINGRNAGLWHSFKTGEGGNLLQLIQKKYGLDFPKSLEYASQLLGLSSEPLSNVKAVLTQPSKAITSLDKTDPKNWTPEQRKSLAYARRLARESKPIQGTLAERYLREHRGILMNTLPKDLRFHSGIYSKINAAIHPALLAIARNKDGKIQAAQAIYLNPSTAKKADVPVVKQTWGILAGSSVNVSRPHNKLTPFSHQKTPHLTYLAEGIETALSVTQSITEGTINATLGKSNFAHPHIPKETQHVVLCLDNDAHPAKADPLIRKAAENLRKQYKTVWMAKPTDIHQDYNDILKHSGSDAVKTNIEKALPFHNGPHPSTQSSQTLGDFLLTSKNNPSPEIKKDTVKSSLERSLNDTNHHSAKLVSTSSPVKSEKIKGIEIEL